MTLVQVTARPVDHPIEKDMLSPSQTTNNDSEYFYEREAEYFGSTPFQLLDEIGEIVVGAAFKMFDSAPTIIGEIIPFLDKGQLTAGLGQWTALVETRFGRNYELFETYVTKNVLLIPDQFVLPHHRHLTITNQTILSDEEVAALDKEIIQLLGELEAAKFEEAQLDAYEQVLRQGEELVAAMEGHLDHLKMESVEYATVEFTGQLDVLKRIVKETIEQSKNYLFAKGEDITEAEERWELEKQLQQLAGTEGDQYAKELAQCQQIATLTELAAWRALL